MTLVAGFTGTQDGMTNEQQQVLTKLMMSEGVTEFHHGDCIGSDAEAHQIAKIINAFTVGHPPINPAKRAFCTVDKLLPEKDYLDRNKDIVDAVRLMFATPKENKEKLRSGTWSTIRYAAKKNKRLFVIYPNGEVARYD